jgi:serine/threonine-protein kinase
VNTDPWAATFAPDEATAQADPGATISPAGLAVARTFAAGAAPSAAFAAPDLPRVSLAVEGADEASDIVLLRELGRGGMGCVHLARQTSFDRTVAVKRVRPDRLCDAAVGALLAEARLSSALDHPNIVPVHLLGRSDAGEPVLVMKRVEGTAWRDLVLAEGPAAARGDALGRHLEILRQVCNAVEFAHRHGVIHRDIKLENVMVGDLGEVYLLDWGVATRVGAPPTTELAGTPAYMAPEMLPGGGEVTPRTDVYLLGATLYELLTGRPLHEGETMWAVLGSALRSDPPELDAGVPDELAALVRRATARDPDGRFAGALAFGEAVAEFQRHRGSLDLSAEADRLLGELRAALAEAASTDDPAPRARARRASQECAFGFRQALRAWPDNAHARDGLRACLATTIAFELAERNAPGAELLLTELAAPAPELADALARLKAALAQEALASAKLARLVRDNDVFLDGSTGGVSPAVFSGLIAAACIGLSLGGVRMSAAGYLTWSGALCVIAALPLYANRAKLMFNRASARRVLATMAVFPFNLCVGLVGYALGTPVEHSVRMAFLGQALMAMTVGITVTPLVLIGVPFYLAALVALLAWPRDALFDLGVLAALQALVNRAEAYAVARAARQSPPSETIAP